MNINQVYYIKNRESEDGVDASSTPVEGYLPVFWKTADKKEDEMEIPENTIKMSKEDYVEFCLDTSKFKFDENNKIIKINNKKQRVKV